MWVLKGGFFVKKKKKVQLLEASFTTWEPQPQNPSLLLSLTWI